VHATPRNRFSIGTANFEKPYGLVNENIIDFSEVARISKVMNEFGFSKVDTALGYRSTKKSQQRDWAPFFRGKQVDTKICLNDISPGSSKISIINFIESQLQELDLAFFETISLHKISDLLIYDGKVLLEALKELQDSGLVRNLGTSIYAPEDLEIVFKAFTPEVVQIPINVFDQRFLLNNTISVLRQQNIRITARSIFLQGLLLSSVDELPTFFDGFKDSLNSWSDFLIVNDLGALEACLKFIEQIEELDTIIIGVNSSKQLKEILEIRKTEKIVDFSSLATDNLSVIDPRNWLK
jgi:aryl-alcohol dehydrogenase-like predicted oxidoreductase